MNTNDRAELYLEKYMTLKDSSALGDLYVLLSPAVFSFVMSIIHDEEESKDIVQDTFMIVAKKVDQYRFGTSVRNWIFEISRNIALARLKKKKDLISLDDADPINKLGYIDPKDNDVSTWNLAKKILKEEDYKILYLYIIGEYKHREIAEILNLPLGTVTWKYKNSLKKLKKVLLVCLIPAFVISGCGKTTKDETENITKQEITAEESAQDEQETGNTETEASGKDPNEKTEEASRDLFAMDTYMNLKAYGKNAQKAVDDAKSEIERLDQLWSAVDKNSEIYQLNQKKKMKVSDETLELIEFAKKKSKESNDAFDISIYPIVELWGFPTQKYRVPSDSEIQKLLKNVNSQKIKINKKTNVVTLEKNMKIDLGGIAKGYTSQRIAKIYKKDGVKSGVISLGGNVQAIGTKTDGSRWKVGVQSPDDTESMIGAYEAADEAVITSGAYERYFEKDGKTYHHIIDPATGKPSEKDLKSVTIISKNGTLSDTLSTTLFVMGKDKAISYWKEHSKEFNMILVDENNKVYISQGIKDHFSSDSDFTVIKK